VVRADRAAGHANSALAQNKSYQSRNKYWMVKKKIEEGKKKQKKQKMIGRAVSAATIFAKSR
jgi:hypothetical protein